MKRLLLFDIDGTLVRGGPAKRAFEIAIAQPEIDFADESVRSRHFIQELRRLPFEDRDEIGRMLFSDPLYAAYGNLLELGKKMATSPTGMGSYVFLAPASERPVIKHVAWQTISLHGREWRVVLAWRPYEK